MKLGRGLLGFHSCIVFLMCLGIAFVCLNYYEQNFQNQITLTQLNVTTALLQVIQRESGGQINQDVSQKLALLKEMEKNTEKYNRFNHLAAISILLVAVFLGFILLNNISIFMKKFERLLEETQRISRSNLTDCELDYPVVIKGTGHEIDKLALFLKQILYNFKQIVREKNFMLKRLQESSNKSS